MAIDFSYYQVKMDLNWEFRKKKPYISATLVLGGTEGGSDVFFSYQGVSGIDHKIYCRFFFVFISLYLVVKNKDSVFM